MDFFIKTCHIVTAFMSIYFFLYTLISLKLITILIVVFLYFPPKRGVPVNTLFSDFICLTIPNLLFIFTDGSVSPYSSGFASYFTADAYTIIHAFQFIFYVDYSNIFIFLIHNHVFYLRNSTLFNILIFTFTFLIKSLIHQLPLHHKNIGFLLIHSHVDIFGNETDDSLVTSTNKTTISFPLKTLSLI